MSPAPTMPAASSGTMISAIILVILFYATVGWAGIQLTYHDGRIAAVWLPNAVLLALALRSTNKVSLIYLLTGFVCNIMLNLRVGDLPVTALALAIGNMAEIGLALLLVRHFCGRQPDISVPRNLNVMLLIAISAPAMSSILPGFVMSGGMAAFSVKSAFKWYSAHALAMATLTPVILIIIDSWRGRHRPTAEELQNWIRLILGSVIVTAAIFGQSDYPFLFLACPIVVVAAFRSDMLGTAISILIVSIIAVTATLLGSGPIMLVQGDLAYKFATLQLFLATCFVIGLPVATVLRSRATIGRELLDNRNLFDQVLKNLGEVVFKTDAEGRWLFLNPPWEAMTGYTVKESKGWPTTKLLVEEDAVAAQPIYARLISGEIDSETLQQRFYHRDGGIRQIEVTVRSLRDEKGRFAGTIGNIRDVTEREQQQRALLESERRFQALSNLAPVGIFRTDAQGGCNYVNQAWLDITGLEHGQWEGDGWGSAMHPDDVEHVSAQWGGAVERREDYEGEFRWVRPDGSVAWTTAFGRPEFSIDGELVGYIGVLMDLTERKLAQEERERRQQELATLALNATDGVMRLSLDGICLYASPSAGTLLGMQSRDLIGESMLVGFHPEDEAHVKEAFATLSAGRKEDLIVAWRTRSRAVSGGWIWLEANCGLVRDDATGAPQEIVVSIRDITASKQMEEDLRAARRKAEHAARAKSAFLANMSHEIRTPMNGVIGFTELVLASDLTDDQRRNVEMIADSGRSMMLLLNDILDMAKIEAGQMSVVEEPLNLARKIEVSTGLMKGTAVSKGLDIRVDIAPDIPTWILGDALRMRQILLNLLGNAVKFTQEGEVSVTARLVPSADGDRISIAVKDSGIGIASNRLEQIFDQFSQADSGIARKFGGTGLGLAISANLARKMGGAITVESEPEVGSTFTLTVPSRPCQAPEHGSDHAFDERAPGALHGQTGRILVAEDHDINQELMKQMAARAGIAIEIARDGVEAVEMVEAAEKAGNPYAMVLMDMQMPRLDGLSATKKLREGGFDAAKLPIFALTANAFAEDIEASRAAGMQGHLAKPLRTRDFIATVRRWGGVRAAPEPQSSAAPKKSLRDRYADRKREALQLVSKALRENRLGDADIGEIAEQLHKVAGTAGFFGEEALGEKARTLEEQLKTGPVDARSSLVMEAAALLSDAA